MSAGLRVADVCLCVILRHGRHNKSAHFSSVHFGRTRTRVSSNNNYIKIEFIHPLGGDTHTHMRAC